MAMRSHPPSGPRAGPNSGSSRLSQRGGVQKRGQQTARADRDGDLDMDSHGAGRGRGRGDRQRHTPTPQTNGHSNPFRDSRRQRVDTTAAQKSIFRAMGVKDSASRGRGASSRPGKVETGRNNNQSGGLDQVVIRGLQQSQAAANADGGLDALITWLERKATAPNSQAVKVKKSRRTGDDIIISVRPEDTVSILRLNNFQFARANLVIELYQQGKPATNTKTVSAEAAEVKALLSNTLSRRYNQEMKLLDLSKLGEDADLINSGLLDSNKRISKFFPALMAICDETFQDQQQKAEAVVNVSIAHNNLINLEQVYKLSEIFPTIKGLDISNNQFKTVHALDKWRFKFPELEHLVVSGNPFEKDDPKFMAKLMGCYYKLKKLETTPGLPTKQVPLRRSPRLSMPIKKPLFLDDADISKNFIIRFFPTFDSDHNALLNEYYDSDSSFSLSVNTQAPREQSATTITPATWDDYMKHSRNLLKINHTKARVNRLAFGRKEIAAEWNALPRVRHADLKSEPEKWCIECHPIAAVPDRHSCRGVGGLIIVTHGEFTQENGAQRSFDRTIVLGPGKGSGGVRVITDMMSLRSYGGFEAWSPNVEEQSCPNTGFQANLSFQVNQNPLLSGQPSPFAPQHHIQQNPLQMHQPPMQLLPVQQQNHPQIPPLPEGFGQPIPGKTAEQLTMETMAMELTSRTHMTVMYSDMCLRESGWNLDNAHQAFERVKGTLPPEAFLPF